MVIQEAVWTYYCLNDASWTKQTVTLSFFFEEVVNAGLLLWYQLFKPLAIIDTPPLSTTTTDTIADPSFKLIRARTHNTDAKRWQLQSLRMFWSLCVSEKTTMTKKSLPHTKTTSTQRQVRTMRHRTLVHNKYGTFPVLKITLEEFVKNIYFPRRQRSPTATRSRQYAAGRLPLIVAASSRASPTCDRRVLLSHK